MTRRSLWPALPLLAAWALWFWRFFFAPGADRIAYPPGDFTETFGVFRDIAYRAVVQGRLPLWADCLWSGYPLHADPQAQVFYPPLWLIFGALRLQGWAHFPIEALAAEVAFHYLVLSCLVFLFLRSLQLSRTASLLGALAFTYGGFLTGAPPLQTAKLEVAIWLPLALQAAAGLAITHRWHYAALTALALTLAYLAGHPQTFVHVALLTFAYFAFRAWQARWGFGPWAASAAALVGLTAAVSAVQLIPSVHFILNSTRAALPFEQSGSGFPFEDMLQFFHTGLVSYWHPLYVGILTLGLAAFALTRREAEVRFWAGAALVSLLLSFGAKAGLYEAAYWLIPGWRLFRNQETLALVTSFALVVLAALGTDILLRPLTRLRRKALGRLQRAALITALAALSWLAVATVLARLGFDPSDWRELPNRAGVFALGAGLALVAIWVRVRVPALRRGWPVLFMSVIAVDLYAANRPLNVVPAFDPFPPSPIIEPLSADPGFFRAQDDHQLAGHAGCAYGYRDIYGVTPYTIASYARFLERAPEPVRWSLLGVRYLITWRAEIFTGAGGRDRIPTDVLAVGTVVDDKGNVTRTHRLPDEPQRAFFVHGVLPATDDEAVASLIAQLNPRTDVILPERVATGPTGSDHVTILRDEPGFLQFQVSAETDAVLVVSEAFFPGWQALIDQQPARVLPANGALMGLAVPAGEHRVELAYRPATLLYGSVISALGLLATIGVFTAGLRSRR
jgi:hypothetical protein